MTAEVAPQIGGRIEVEHVGDLLDRHVRRGEQMLDLHHDLPVDELLGRRLRDSGSYLRKVVGCDAELVGIEFHLVLRIAVLRHQFAEAVEKAARRGDGFDIPGRSIENQLDLHCEKQILQLIPYHHTGRLRGRALSAMVDMGIPCLRQYPFLPGGRQYRLVVDAFEKYRRERQDDFIGERGGDFDQPHPKITAGPMYDEQRVGKDDRNVAATEHPSFEIGRNDRPALQAKEQQAPFCPNRGAERTAQIRHSDSILRLPVSLHSFYFSRTKIAQFGETTRCCFQKSPCCLDLYAVRTSGKP